MASVVGCAPLVGTLGFELHGLIMGAQASADATIYNDARCLGGQHLESKLQLYYMCLNYF